MDSDKLIGTLLADLPLQGRRVASLGIDLVHIPRIAQSLRDFGAAFARKLYTPAEIAYADAAPGQEAERYAARFAAKEAAIKALGLSEAGVGWPEMEVVRHPDGHCTLALHGQALAIARARGITGALVCLSHDGEYAAAVVAALSDSDGAAEFAA